MTRYTITSETLDMFEALIPLAAAWAQELSQMPDMPDETTEVEAWEAVEAARAAMPMLRSQVARSDAQSAPSEAENVADMREALGLAQAFADEAIHGDHRFHTEVKQRIRDALAKPQ